LKANHFSDHAAATAKGVLVLEQAPGGLEIIGAGHIDREPKPIDEFELPPTLNSRVGMRAVPDDARLRLTCLPFRQVQRCLGVRELL